MRSAVYFVLGASLSAGTLALAAPGDLIYRDQAAAEVTSVQGDCYAACAVADGTWSGAADDLESVCGSKQDDGKWQMTVGGLKTDTASNVATLAGTKRVEVVGAVE
jgi:hypothetical protein